MAYVMYRALLNSGVAWPLVRPEAAPEELTVRVTRAAKNENDSTSDITSEASELLRRLLRRASGAWGLPHAEARTFAGAGYRRDEAVEGRQS